LSALTTGEGNRIARLEAKQVDYEGVLPRALRWVEQFDRDQTEGWGDIGTSVIPPTRPLSLHRKILRRAAAAPCGSVTDEERFSSFRAVFYLAGLLIDVAGAIPQVRPRHYFPSVSLSDLSGKRFQ
jgi:hypothetical protein